MAKWADYLISQVSYDQNHIITKVMQHRDIGNKISGGEIVDRNVIATNLGHGSKYMTVFGDLDRLGWEKMSDTLEHMMIILLELMTIKLNLII